MSRSERSRALRCSTLAYTVLLCAYPRRFRRDHGSEMLATFLDLLSRARARGGTPAACRHWLLTLRDALTNAGAMHLGRVTQPDEPVGLAGGRFEARRNADDPRRHVAASRGAGRAMGALVGDLRYGLRGLRRQPLFAAVAILTLAVGIGANTAIFSVVSGVLLRPLPYADEERLVQIRATDRSGAPLWNSFPDVEDWRGSALLESVAGATFPRSVTVLGGTEPLRTGIVGVTEGFWRQLGVRPLRGRLLTADEHEGNATPVVLVSEGLWRTGFESGPRGEVAVRFDGKSFVVVGVLPQSVALLTGGDIWYPLEPHSLTSLTVRGNRWLQVLGRVGDGVELTTLHSELTAITLRNQDDVEPRFASYGVALRPLRAVLLGDVDRPLRLLWGGAGLVLLVACTNLVSMLMARGAGRAEELSIRTALGAGRGRLVRQLLVESAVLVGAGAALGGVLAHQVIQALRVFGNDAVPRLDDIVIDARVLMFTLAVAGVTTVLVGVVPALRSTSGSGTPVSTRRSDGGAVAGSRRQWVTLVAAEVALAVILVLGAGLLVHSLMNLLNEDLGFQTGGVLTVQFTPPASRLETERDLATYLEDISSLLGTAPGVTAVGMTSQTPLDAGNYTTPFLLEDGSRSPGVAGYRVVGGDYFDVLKIPLLAGRMISHADGPTTPPVVVVNRSLARQTWPGEDAVGKVIRIEGMDMHPNQSMTVVGVVDEARHWSMSPGTQPELYVPVGQRSYVAAFQSVMVVRVATASAGLAAVFRERLRAYDPELPIEVATMNQRLGSTAADRQFVAAILTAFAAVALALASVGIYAVVSYALARRRHEFGVRRAVGATASRLLANLMLSALAPVAAGIVAGLLLSALGARLLTGMLYGIEPFDLLNALQAGTVIGLAAVVACWGPARRASRVDPVEAIRAQ